MVFIIRRSFFRICKNFSSPVSIVKPITNKNNKANIFSSYHTSSIFITKFVQLILNYPHKIVALIITISDFLFHNIILPNEGSQNSSTTYHKKKINASHKRNGEDII